MSHYPLARDLDPEKKESKRRAGGGGRLQRLLCNRSAREQLDIREDAQKSRDITGDAGGTVKLRLRARRTDQEDRPVLGLDRVATRPDIGIEHEFRSEPRRDP